MIPTSIDGTDITGATIDGTDVQEITVDGQTVFTSSQIPDTGMDHFYWSKELSSIDPWPDEEGNNDASPNGNPQLVASGINSNQSVEYDGNDDHKTGSPGSLGTSDEWTAAGVFQITRESGTHTVFENGDGSDGYAILLRFDVSGDPYNIIHRGVGGPIGGTVDTDPHVFVATYNGTTAILDIDGSQVISGSLGSPNSPTTRMTFGARSNGGEEFEGYIGALGHEAAFADAARRDELTDLLAEPFGITTST